MSGSIRRIAWGIAFLVLTVFAVPWFLWGESAVVAGLPVWLWWHVGWMLLATIVFYQFTRSAWDDLMGVEDGEKRADVRPDGGTISNRDCDDREVGR